MTLTIILPPDTGARLQDQAAATGKDVSTLVREAIEEKLAADGTSPASNLPYAKWASQFTAWMREVDQRAAMYPSDYIADDSRDSIYQDRGE
jgi:predicted transcriptional regulator